jgi:hypothetical protein
VLCGIGLLGRQRLRMAAYVMGTGTTRGQPLLEGASVDYPLEITEMELLRFVKTDIHAVSNLFENDYPWALPAVLGFLLLHVHVVRFTILSIPEAKRGSRECFQAIRARHAYAYPSLVTNSDNEVGISLAWGGGPLYSGSHAVGILGDFVVWFGDASDTTVERNLVDPAGKVVTDKAGNPILAPTRFGDYMHVRLAYPDTRYFSAFGYAVKNDPTRAAPEVGKFVYSYVEFGRQFPEPSPVR